MAQLILNRQQEVKNLGAKHYTKKSSSKRITDKQLFEQKSTDLLVGSLLHLHFSRE